MKRVLLLLLCVLFSTLLPAQQKLVFGYDAAGNETYREFICINCITEESPEKAPETPDNPESHTEETTVADALEKESDTEDRTTQPPTGTETQKNQAKFSYYPNPIEEALYINWENNTDTTIHTIAVYTIGGRLIQAFTDLSARNNLTVSFNTLPTGMYCIQLLYRSGKRKTLNIIKK